MFKIKRGHVCKKVLEIDLYHNTTQIEMGEITQVVNEIIIINNIFTLSNRNG